MCNLEDLVEFNACIMSGRDFLCTDINAIDQGSREWLAPQGIQSLIATPLVGANNAIFGFAGFDFVKAPCKEFTERIIFNIHEAADLLLNCQRLHAAQSPDPLSQLSPPRADAVHPGQGPPPSLPPQA